MISTWISQAMREELYSSGFLIMLAFAVICFLAGFWFGRISFRDTGDTGDSKRDGDSGQAGSGRFNNDE